MINTQLSQDNNFQVDLTNCDREPIHIPGLVQAHGILIALDAELQIRQISVNCAEHFGRDAEDVLNQPLENLIGAEYTDYLKSNVLVEDITNQPLYLNLLSFQNKTFETLAHSYQEVFILEFERLPEGAEFKINPNIYSSLSFKLREINKTQSVAKFCERAAETVRSFTGFDRVMIYRFLEDESGEVIAESAKEDLEPFLGLRYPASDIPKQARILYLNQTLRFKVDVDDSSSPIVPTINPQTQKPLDMSYAATRAMSPIHVEYLKNLNVAASMSISIVKDGRLWGLIACHHQTPRYISHQVRMVSEFIAHTISLEVESKSNTEHFEYISQLKDSISRIIEELSRFSDVPQYLIHGESNLLSALKSDGAALILEDKLYLLGQTPGESQVKKLIARLSENQPENIFSTNQISKFFPPAEEYEAEASGLLAVRLSNQTPEYLMWFRAEQAHTVTWGGNPEKPVTVGKFGDQLTPRKSFEAWREEVRGQSAPWKSFEIEYAESLRRSIIEVILRRAGELRELNRQLEVSNDELDSFAYVASHDLKEPLRGINNYSNFLLEDYGTQLDEEAIERLNTLVRLTERMENLLDSLIHYSRVGRLELHREQIGLQEILDDTLLFLRSRIEQSNVRILVPQPLPSVYVDAVRVGEIFSNLLSNAIKYNDQPETQIEIGVIERVTQNIAGADQTAQIIYVKDNGIGIEEKHTAAFSHF